MEVVKRIFYMVGIEGKTIRAVKRTFEREGLPSPGGKPSWSGGFIRRCILDDVYKPHTYEEIEALLTPGVTAHLLKDKRYGVWWFNRTRVTRTQVAENDAANGRRYRKRAKHTTKPQEEWIAVPTPDPGIPREWVDAAREAIATNTQTSKNGGRFWELSGGMLRCASCGWAMGTNAVKNKGSDKRNHYYRCAKHQQNPVEGCLNRKSHRADKLEPQVWELISSILTDPEQLCADLERMIELEREGMRGDPEREAKAWLEKLSELDRKRSAYQDQQAEGLITLDELRAKLSNLEETRTTAQEELEALRGRRERIEELERDRDVLVERYAGMVPEALDALSPKERHHVYKLLKLRVRVDVDGTLEVDGVLGETEEVCKVESTPQMLRPGSRLAWKQLGVPRLATPIGE
jgi:flagellar motility protein MotE (MotC chaperone)